MSSQTPFEFFQAALTVVFHSSLTDSKSPQVSMTLGFVADVSIAVICMSNRELCSQLALNHSNKYWLDKYSFFLKLDEFEANLVLTCFI